MLFDKAHKAIANLLLVVMTATIVFYSEQALATIWSLTASEVEPYARQVGCA